MAKAKINFEQSIGKLNSLVDEMEHGNLSLEDSLKKFSDGVKLIRDCQVMLKSAEQKVQILTEKNGTATLEDYQS